MTSVTKDGKVEFRFFRPRVRQVSVVVGRLGCNSLLTVPETQGTPENHDAGRQVA